jgi:hypothetical protein
LHHVPHYAKEHRHYHYCVDGHEDVDDHENYDGDEDRFVHHGRDDELRDRDAIYGDFRGHDQNCDLRGHDHDRDVLHCDLRGHDHDRDVLH